MTTAVFLAVVCGVPLIVGFPVAVQPSVQQLPLATKGSLAWATGCLFLTMFLTLLSAVGIPWTLWCVAFPCVAALAVAARQIRKTHLVLQRPVDVIGSRASFSPLCFAFIAGIGLFLFVFAFATSADLSYFWGVKAAHFAIDRGIDFELLRQPHLIHLHPNYPPLWPVLLGCGAMIAGTMPWFAVPPLTWLCLTAGAAIVFGALETRLGARAAGVVTCLWYAVLTAMMVRSFSGGNAEGYLVMSVSVALVVILTEVKDEPPQLRWLAAIFLAGAVFTKSEGIIIGMLIACGTVVRDVAWRRRGVLRQTALLISPAVATAAVWIIVRMAHGVRLTDPIRETAFHVTFDHIGLIVQVCARFLVTGAVTAGWLVPLVAVLVVARRRVDRAIPSIVTAVGILGFAMTYYLHAMSNPLQLIGWTFPRLVQPAISAWILGGGVAVFSLPDARDTRSTIPDGPDR